MASLNVVYLAGLLYVQIYLGTPEDRDAALGTAARMEALQRPADAPVAAAPPIANAPATVESPAKPVTKFVAVARKEMSPSPAAAPVRYATQTMANATTDRTYSAPSVEADAALKLVSRGTDQIGSTKSVVRMDPGATVLAAAAAPAKMQPYARCWK